MVFDNRTVVKLIVAGMVLFSIIVTYYNIIVSENYEVLYSETGLPELDE